MATCELFQFDIHGRQVYDDNGKPVMTTVARALLGDEFATAAPGTLRLQPLPGFPEQAYVAPFVPAEQNQTTVQPSAADQPRDFGTTAEHLDDSSATSKTYFTWSHSDVLLLVETFAKHQQSFNSHLQRKSNIWDTIAAEMNTIKGVDYFKGNTCNKKWSNLEQRYKEKRDKLGKTGRGGGGRDWPYFVRMDELLGSSASVASVSLSCKLPKPSTTTSSSVLSPSMLTLSSDSLAAVSVSKSSTIASSCVSSDLISPPSDSSDGEEHDKSASKSVGETCAKRQRLGQKQSQFQNWATKFSSDMAAWHEKTDKRLESLENIERERVGVLKEMKDLMAVWVECVKEKRKSES